MVALISSSSFLGFTLQHQSHYFTPKTDKWNIRKLSSLDCRLTGEESNKRTQLRRSSCEAMCSTSTSSASAVTLSSGGCESSKKVWIWTENKQVMTASVERGWNTFLFSSKHWQLADDWSSIAFIHPLFIEEGNVLDAEDQRVATIIEVSSPEELQLLKPETGFAENVIIDLLDWQIIPAENIVAAFQGSQKTVFAVSKTASEAQIYLEALEQGLGGVVLRVEDVEGVIALKEYFDKRNESGNLLSMTKATVTRVQTSGMGDRVCVDLCSLMRPGEGLLVGCFARGLFLVHSECLESNYIASRPFRVNAGPVHAYVSVPGGKTCYLSELKAGKEVVVVGQKGQQRTAIIGRVKIETRPLVLVEAKINSDDQTLFSIFLQNAETVALIPPCQENGLPKPAIPVTSLRVGDEILLRVQGAARHTGIEIQEFIVEN